MLVPTLPDPGSQPWQLFGLLVEEHGDPRYDTVFLNLGAVDLPCSYPLIQSYCIFIIQGVGAEHS